LFAIRVSLSYTRNIRGFAGFGFVAVLNPIDGDG